MQNHPNPNIWWKHRRKMAYIAILWAIVKFFLLCFLSLYNPEVVESLSTAIGWSYGLCSTIIIAYFTNTTVDTFKQNKDMIDFKGK